MNRITRTVPAVCPISRNQAIPGQAGTMLPYVPRAIDVPSAIQALNQINNIIQMIAGPGPVVNNFGIPPLSYGLPVVEINNTFNYDSGGGTGQKTHFIEYNRVTEPVQICNPDDEGVFVEFKRISRIEFQNVSGLRLTWFL